MALPSFSRVIKQQFTQKMICFVRSLIDQQLWEQSVRFDYLGYIFSGHKDDVQAIAEWLWSNVPAPPSSVKVTKINGETFFVHPKP
jgi:hypothetical protein